MTDPAPAPSDDRLAEVQSCLDMVRPAMEADAGGVELVGVNGDVVQVRLLGSCLVCPSSALTLREGIERTLRARLPWVTRVERVA